MTSTRERLRPETVKALDALKRAIRKDIVAEGNHSIFYRNDLTYIAREILRMKPGRTPARRPCVFCGHRKTSVSEHYGSDVRYCIACAKCDARGPEEITVREAVEAWNAGWSEED